MLNLWTKYPIFCVNLSFQKRRKIKRNVDKTIMYSDDLYCKPNLSPQREI